MTSASRVAGRARVKLYAACFAVIFGGGVAGCARGAPPPGPGAYAPPPGPAAYAPPSYAAPVPGNPPPGVMMAQAGPERGLTKAQFIERRRQAATRQGQNPEQAAATAPRLFDMIDTNHDGIIDRAEIDAFRAAHAGAGGAPHAAPGAAPMQ